MTRPMTFNSRLWRACTRISLAATLIALAMPPAALAQAAPTVRTLVDTRGSIVVGDVTITNFRAPFEYPVYYSGSPLVPDRGDRLAVSASVDVDGTINLVFTAIDPLTGAAKPEVSTRALANEFTSFVTYDVVVTNPLRALHGVASSFGPATAGAVYNTHYAYTGPQAGTLFGTPISGMLPGNFTGFPAIGLLPTAVNWLNTPIASADFRGARIGHRWGIEPFSFGLGLPGTADSLTVSLILADAVPLAPGATPRIDALHADSVFLTAPAGAGGATLSLVSGDPTLLTVPATVTVPQGSTYAVWPIKSTNASNIFRFPAAVTGTLGADVQQASDLVFPDVWPPGLPVTPQMSILKLGTGRGTVTSNGGLVCGKTCAGSVRSGFVYTVTAQPASGSQFSGWQGVCTGSLALSCDVPITIADVVVTAVFDQVVNAGGGGGGGGGAGTTFTLSIGRSNPGTVISDVAGISCGNVCSATFAQSTAVSLTATPPAGKFFVGWGGACSGTSPVCSLTINANASVQANFSK